MTDPLPPAGPRMLPRVDDTNRDFWTGGREGRLMVPRCRECRRWFLPPGSDCPRCGGGAIYEPVSGRATVYTWTVNHQKFHPDIEPPNLIAVVVLDEQDDLRLATNLVDVDPGQVHAGMAVTVRFEDRGEVFYPLFAPVREAA